MNLTSIEFLDSLNRFNIPVTQANNSVNEGIIEYKKTALDGTTLGIIREGKTYVIKKELEGKFEYIGGVQNKTKNIHESYQTALKVLNLMCSEIAKSGDVLEEKRFVLKQPIPRQDPPIPEPTAPTDEPEMPEDEPMDEPVGDEMPEIDDEEPNDSEDLGVGDKKDIQKTGGKLAYDLRNYDEDDYSDLVKWAMKSMIAAIDPSKMDSNDTSDITNAIAEKLDGDNEGEEEMPEVDDENPEQEQMPDEEVVDEDFDLEDEPETSFHKMYGRNITIGDCTPPDCPPVADDDLKHLLYDEDTLLDEEDEYPNSFDEEEYSGQDLDDMARTHQEFKDKFDNEFDDEFDLNLDLENLMYEDDEELENNVEENLDDKIISYELYNAHDGKVIIKMAQGRGRVASVVEKFKGKNLYLPHIELISPLTLELENPRGTYVLKIKGDSDDHLIHNPISYSDLEAIGEKFKQTMNEVYTENIVDKKEDNSELVEKELDKLLNRHNEDNEDSKELKRDLRKFYNKHKDCDYPRKDDVKEILNEQ